MNGKKISRHEQLKNKANWEEDGQLYLVRCMNCGNSKGTENWALAVSTGHCAFCGWKDENLVQSFE